VKADQKTKLKNLRSFKERLANVQVQLFDMYVLAENLGYSPNNMLLDELRQAQRFVEDAWVSVNIMIDDIEDEMEDDN
jgi:hypothetical protein